MGERESLLVKNLSEENIANEKNVSNRFNKTRSGKALRVFISVSILILLPLGVFFATKSMGHSKMLKQISGQNKTVQVMDSTMEMSNAGLDGMFMIYLTQIGDNQSISYNIGGYKLEYRVENGKKSLLSWVPNDFRNITLTGEPSEAFQPVKDAELVKGLLKIPYSSCYSSRNMGRASTGEFLRTYEGENRVWIVLFSDEKRKDVAGLEVVDKDDNGNVTESFFVSFKSASVLPNYVEATEEDQVTEGECFISDCELEVFTFISNAFENAIANSTAVSGGE